MNWKEHFYGSGKCKIKSKGRTRFSAAATKILKTGNNTWMEFKERKTIK
jgi:hypothetical protein